MGVCRVLCCVSLNVQLDVNISILFSYHTFFLKISQLGPKDARKEINTLAYLNLCLCCMKVSGCTLS